MLATSGSIYKLVSAWNREIWKLFCCFDSVVDVTEKLSDIWDYIRIFFVIVLFCFALFYFVLFVCGLVFLNQTYHAEYEARQFLYIEWNLSHLCSGTLFLISKQ